MLEGVVMTNWEQLWQKSIDSAFSVAALMPKDQRQVVQVEIDRLMATAQHTDGVIVKLFMETVELR